MVTMLLAVNPVPVIATYPPVVGEQLTPDEVVQLLVVYAMLVIVRPLDDDDDDDDDEQIEKEMKEGLDEKKKDASTAHINFDILENEEDDEEEEYEEDEEDDSYFQRFHENMKKNIVEDFHPEMKYHNYDEIEALTSVVRDENGRIIDPNHRTMPFITKYEKTRILGERAKQINAGAQPFIEVDDDIIDGYLIALKEFEQKKIPFIIKRPVAGNRIEYWKLSDLEIL